jgi:hypothetical protein
MREKSRICSLSSSDRGAMLIMVALSIFGIMALSAFVFDYGVFWYARRQAQNAADAGALAGAEAIYLDSETDLSNTGPAYVSAQTVAGQNNVFGEAPGVRVFVDPNATWDHPAPGPSAAAGAGCNPGETCVQVDVYRDGTHDSNALPVYFATLFGQSSEGVRATATAKAAVANASGCMRPWFIPDQYNDVDGNGVYNSPPDTLNSYSVSPPAPPPGDVGKWVTFHPNSSPSSYGQLDVGSGGNAIRNAIEHCVTGVTFSVGETVLTKPGGTQGPEIQGINNLLSWDPDRSAGNPNGVYWDPIAKVVLGGCAPAGTCACPNNANECPYAGGQSPRIVQAAICDPSDPQCNGTAQGAGTVTITNILSFFIMDVCGAGVMGPNNLCLNDPAGSNDPECFQSNRVCIQAVLIGSGGSIVAGPSPAPGNSFMKQVILVR